MSKTLGNGVDPLDVIDEYGTDSLRMSLILGTTPGNDIRYSSDKVEASSNFANKLWNASKFVLMQLEDIEEFKEKKDLISIRAEIFCEREAHKRILIGKNGEMLKKIGSYAREDLEKFFGIQVYLNLWVKVKENWRDSDFLVANFGYDKKDLDQ